MKLFGVLQESLMDGPGCNLVVVTQGCNICCEGCHNEDLWDINGGKVWTEDEIFSLLTKATDGVTVSGGEPTLQGEAVLSLLTKAKAQGLRTNLFTGLTKDAWMKYPLRTQFESVLDYIKIGPYIKDQRDTTKMYGSTNQAFYMVAEGRYYKL